MAEIKNLTKAAKRVLKAVKDRQNIIVYGDGDLDGISSAIIAKEAITSLGGKVCEVYFPNREAEGYGLNEKALGKLKKHLPALLITLDCGIGNFREMKLAKKMGFEVIIIDHHEILDKLPVASVIVDPKQKGDKYPFKKFAAAGLAFKFAETLFGGQMPEALRKNFLELATLATIADMMPQEKDNAEIIAEGLNYLKSSWRPGIQALFNLVQFKDFNLDQKISKVNSLLNIEDGMGLSMPSAFRILNITSEKEAEKMANDLFERGIKKRARVKEIADEISSKIDENRNLPVFLLGSSDWDLPLLGVCASLLSPGYGKPIFLYKKGKEESQGAIRAPNGYNVVEPMKKFSQKLMTFGGHPQAAGFRIKNKNLPAFEKHLIKYFSNL